MAFLAEIGGVTLVMDGPGFRLQDELTDVDPVDDGPDAYTNEHYDWVQNNAGTYHDSDTGVYDGWGKPLDPDDYDGLAVENPWAEEAYWERAETPAA